MWKISSTAHSNNVKLMKTSKLIKLGLFRNQGLTPKPNKSRQVGLFKKPRVFSSLLKRDAVV